MICQIAGCDKPVFIKKRRLCKPHYMRAWNAGEFGQLAADDSTRVEPHRATQDGCSTCGPDVPLLEEPDGRKVCSVGERASRLRMIYKLTPEQFDTMLDTAGHRCQICRTPIDETTAHIDHDHGCCPTPRKTCGKCIRGLLCNLCNTGIGWFRDDPDTLTAAIAYLRSNLTTVGDPG